MKNVEVKVFFNTNVIFVANNNKFINYLQFKDITVI